MVSIIHNDLPIARETLSQFFRQSAPKSAAKVMRKRIIRKTRSGRNVEGERFTKYSWRYAKFRKSHNLSTNPVDLYALGSDGEHMLDSLDYYDNIQVTEGTGHALAVSARTNPRALGNQKLRYWLGVATSDGEPILHEIDAQFSQLKVGQPVPTISIL